MADDGNTNRPDATDGRFDAFPAFMLGARVVGAIFALAATVVSGGFALVQIVRAFAVAIQSSGG